MILRAKLVVPVSEPPIDNGAVEVTGEIITAVGAASELTGDEVRDLGEVALAPGLINAHCHFDYTDMRGLVPWRGRFADWVMAITELKQQWTEEQFLASIQNGLRQALAAGTTSVVNIECFPNLIARLAPSPLRVWWCPELIDLGKDSPAQMVGAALEAIQSSEGRGLSPHALYTASPALYQECMATGLLLTTHLAETAEEEEMFRWGRGPLYDRFVKLGRDMSDCRHTGPVELAHGLGVLGPNCLAAHMNFLTAHEIGLVAETGTHVAHCPRTHRFFQRGLSLLEAFRKNGVNVCLGTDSLASNDRFDMFAEMQELAKVFPHWSAEEILQLTTVNAAKALNEADHLGKIAPGAAADLIAVPLEEMVVDPYEAVVFAEKPVCFSMIGGKVVIG